MSKSRGDKAFGKTSTVYILALFLILALTSLSAVYYTHQLPVTTKSVVSLCKYRHYGTFNCTATLKPNLIYGRSTLSLSEGYVFRRITEEININFTYTFISTKPANLTIHLNVSQFVQTSIWRIQIGEMQQRTIKANGTSIGIVDIPPIEVGPIQELVNKIAEETGTRATEYVATVTMEMSIKADTSVGTINNLFTHELTMRFTSGISEGDIISIESSQHVEDGEITRTRIIYQSWVPSQRYVSYALSIVSLPGLLISAWGYSKQRSTKSIGPEALIEEIIKPFEEVISRTAEPESREHRFVQDTVLMKTLEDLVKVADILDKPILHALKPPETHLFYIIDGATRYQYVMTESSIAERAETGENE